jgi:hypothetical protein
MNLEEFKTTVSERFLELTDIYPDFTPYTYERGRYFFLEVGIVFKSSAISTMYKNSIEYQIVTPEIIQEIIEYCFFIKNYLGIEEFKIQSITFSRNQFMFSAKFLK